MLPREFGSRPPGSGDDWPSGQHNGAMTGISASGGGESADATEALAPGPAEGTPARWSGSATVRRWISALEHSQDVITVTVGVVLIVLAVVLLITGMVDFVGASSKGISTAAENLLDRVLFVLILIEIVHTVVLSLRAHRLVAQPFIVVGLIAVVRRILVVLTPGSGVPLSTSEVALLIAMVAVFVAGLIAVSRFEKSEE
jgi:uncharacterized membrane protein (DUF373 family)